jgi:electron transport protein HydN
MNRFVITEPASCIGCRTCEVACALAHQEANEIVVRQESFLPRLKVVISKEITSTVQCRHCDDAPCVNVCPTNALVYSQNSVQFIAERCIGCKTCVIACPFGAMNMIVKPVNKSVAGGISANAMQPHAHKCDLCIDFATGPACIQACPTKAIHLMDPASIDDMLRTKRELAVSDPAPGVVR